MFPDFFSARFWHHYLPGAAKSGQLFSSIFKKVGEDFETQKKHRQGPEERLRDARGVKVVPGRRVDRGENVSVPGRTEVGRPAPT